MREEGLVCGALSEQAALPCSRDKDVAHSLPDGRGRKEGRGCVCRENMFLGLGKEGCWKGRGAPGPGESNSISPGPTAWLQSCLRALACLCYWLAQWSSTF